MCNGIDAKRVNTAVTYVLDRRFSKREKQSIKWAAAAWNVRGPGIRNSITLVPESRSGVRPGPRKDNVDTVSIPRKYPAAAGKTAAAAIIVADPDCADNGIIREVDIVFRDMPWTHLLYPPFDKLRNNMPIRAVHEFGHGFGLAHENGRLATMNEDYPHGGVVGGREIVPHADDLVGLRDLYGIGETGRDVAASAYYHPCDRKPGPGCSSRKVVEIDLPSGRPIVGGPPFRITYTVENRGTMNCHDCRIDFYISPDRNIAPSAGGSDDVHIGTTMVDLPAGSTKTGTASLGIPPGVVEDRNYHVGFIVDRFNANGTPCADLLNNTAVLKDTLGVAKAAESPR